MGHSGFGRVSGFVGRLFDEISVVRGIAVVTLALGLSLAGAKRLGRGPGEGDALAAVGDCLISPPF